MMFKGTAEGVERGKAELFRDLSHAFALEKIFQRDIHAALIEILMRSQVIGGKKASGQMLSGISKLVTQLLHIKGKILDVVNVAFDLLGNRIDGSVLTVDTGKHELNHGD